MTSSSITREDYAKNPQAVLEVLEFYTDHQKREYEEFGTIPARVGAPSTSSRNDAASPSMPSLPSAARFNAGTGLAGANVRNDSSLNKPPLPQSRPPNFSRENTSQRQFNDSPYGDESARSSPNNSSGDLSFFSLIFANRMHELTPTQRLCPRLLVPRPLALLLPPVRRLLLLQSSHPLHLPQQLDANANGERPKTMFLPPRQLVLSLMTRTSVPHLRRARSR